MQDDKAKAHGWGRCSNALTFREPHYVSHQEAGEASFQPLFLSICLPSVGWGAKLCITGHYAISLVVAREAGGHKRESKGWSQE